MSDASPVVLLLEPDPARARPLARALRAAVAAVDVCKTLQDVPPRAEYDLLVADFDGLAAPDQERLCSLFSGLKQRQRLLIYSRGRAGLGFADLLGRYAMTNVLARNDGPDPDELLVTVQKLLRKDIFGLQKYFPWSSDRLDFEVRSSLEVTTMAEHAGRFAQKMGANGRLADAYCTVADELCSNAIYNAPLGPDGSPRYAHFSRAQTVTLDPGESVTVALACDARRLGISVSDPFGSLRAAKVVAYLAKCLRRGADQVDQKPGGAGLGLFSAFEAVSHFVVNIHQGKRTEMIGLLDIQGSYRDFAEKGKSFNVFVEE